VLVTHSKLTILAKWRKENFSLNEAMNIANCDRISRYFSLKKYPRPADKS